MKLEEPITIRGVTFKNRMVMPPMQVGVGMRGRRARAYYAERARGGAGTIIMAATSVDAFCRDEAWGQPGGAEAFVDGIRPVIDEVHETGARIGVQLWHDSQFPSGTGARGEEAGEPVGPSAADDRRELTVPEIAEIVSRFAEATANARRAGMDFVEVHGAHGYLVCQFFSPASNRRRDDYGGDLDGRMRFGLELVTAMRVATGDDFPIFYRLGVWEDIEGGIATADSVKFAVELERAGVDLIDVSLGAMTGARLTASPGADQPEGTLVSFAHTVKRSVGVPVLAVGRFRTPEVAERVLESGRADMVAIGRQLIADPYWPEKATNGRAEDIAPCISCNNCFNPIRTGERLRCSVNAAAGREAETIAEAATTPRRVMVVGGGPGGMEAARVAASRGHDVTLYERQRQLGGQLIPASVPPHKQELAQLQRYLVRQLEKSGAAVELGVDATPELVAREKPDVFVSAIGPVSFVPDIPGIERNNVVTDLDILAGAMEIAERVVVIGGELVGCEIADYLSDQGRRVAVVRRGGELATNVAPDIRATLLARLEDKGVELLPGVREYREITGEGVVLVDAEGRERLLPAETIVLATGATANDLLARAIEGAVGEVYLVGDCAEPGRIVDAIHDGARVGRDIK
ncbi:MAG: FAD-dependent oxidoreductase [Dehalococcoidales bacterium]